MSQRNRVVVIGGAGFVGSHVADSFLSEGFDVTVFDAKLRRGSEVNLAWLRERHRGMCVTQGDVRDLAGVTAAVRDADVIFHLAGQVAVTTSVEDPATDFEINARGTLNVLEAARASGRRPIVVFTSTNKVYGGMEDVEIVERPTRYEFAALPHGVSESRPLDFHSPYGCSKGAAEQYVRDYARIYGLPTVVFRMSCIYGPRQFGTEDQGWLAHFAIAAANGGRLTIWGDGKQVRDILFVEDLVRAFRLAVENIEVTAGNVYNIGGGPGNTISVWAEFGDVIAELTGDEVPVRYEHWRPGDQLCYVSDTRRAERDMGWTPAIEPRAGIRRLWDWVSTSAVTVPAVQADGPLALR
jgi:CDP-paratose 2-epimerase